jgi:hypothetical protein
LLPGRRGALAGTVTLRNLRPGRHRIAVRLRPAAMRALRRARRPAVKLTVRMVGRTGRPLVLTRTVKLSR